jgi:tRNA dimethylallyltransferase
MQLYQGLPVITNKITTEETKGVPHHLLGCIELEQETWTVGKFVSNALSVVSSSDPHVCICVITWPDR